MYRYLTDLKARCNSLEALLGILLSLKDPRTVSLLTELTKDPYAESILEQVREGPFGPKERVPRVEGSSPTVKARSDGMSTSSNPILCSFTLRVLSMS